jgi:uncharacterized protein (TIGR03437 family)
VSRNRILDSKSRPYLIRGTELPVLTLTDSPSSADAPQFGAFSGSAFVTLRHRMNMNAVRLPLNGREYRESPRYVARAREIVQRANRFELLAILAEDPLTTSTGDDDVSFWARLATDFKDDPNVFFAISGRPIAATVVAIRSSGATQPIIAAADPESSIPDPNIILEINPSFAAIRTDRERWSQLGRLTEHVPVLANGLDPELDRDSSECAAFPQDPAAASSLLLDTLSYFDTHSISWTISTFRPGRLITDYRYYTWTKLDDGWTCGVSPSRDGIAMLLLAHLWSADVHGLFAVNQTTGGFLMARGSTSTAYGPIMADREMSGGDPPFPTVLGNVSVRVTDSRGIARLAPLLATGGGWSQVTFVVPDTAATGPAEVAVMRTDGTSSAAKVMIADVAPGIWTSSHDGRGPVIAWVQQRTLKGPSPEFPAWECAAGACRTVPIPLGKGASTTVRLEGTGFRHIGPRSAVRVTVGDVSVPVMSFRGMPGNGRDQLTFQLPMELRGRGETDLVMSVDGVFSNVVRINCGAL